MTSFSIILGDVDRENEDHILIQGDWHSNLGHGSYTSLNNCNGNRAGPYGARIIRDSVANYFQTNRGRVSWQDKYAFTD